MIGYDLDGVLVPEFKWIEGETPESILQKTLTLRPIFQPSGPYAIITGRSNSEITLQWISENLKTEPTQIFINKDNWHPALFKAANLSLNPQITAFVESDLEQVQIIKELCLTQEIIHIDDLLNNNVTITPFV